SSRSSPRCARRPRPAGVARGPAWVVVAGYRAPGVAGGPARMVGVRPVRGCPAGWPAVAAVADGPDGVAPGPALVGGGERSAEAVGGPARVGGVGAAGLVPAWPAPPGRRGRGRG